MYDWDIQTMKLGKVKEIMLKAKIHEIEHIKW